jgi:hypothetical protein
MFRALGRPAIAIGLYVILWKAYSPLTQTNPPLQISSFGAVTQAFFFHVYSIAFTEEHTFGHTGVLHHDGAIRLHRLWFSPQIHAVVVTTTELARSAVRGLIMLQNVMTSLFGVSF